MMMYTFALPKPNNLVHGKQKPFPVGHSISKCILFWIAENKKLSVDSFLNFPTAYFSKNQNKYEDLEDWVSGKQRNTVEKTLLPG